ncbi:hypothetical protein R0135_11765 [Congregibacter variabilis]|uniref:Uncharacterized protein n=1 Tax=Congregibacter variabilis TaxID=3081200 RepID=A0ABZ0HYZ1_9GAMM|nr:hypothetical protein R0135_11765 [Congregibacter sp. IMCC43200]
MIAMLEVSPDGGQQWRAAKPREDLGRFSFREWRLPVSDANKGPATLMVRATSNKGEMQPREAS